MKPLPRLYAIADASFGNPRDLAAQLFEGGARLVQVRDKSATAGTLLSEVETILKISPDDATVIVNDRADVARIAVAAGVHLGQTDLSPDLARRVVTPDQIIGRSTHTLEQALEADRADVDYIAAGPVFPTATKKNPEATIGLDGLREICSRVHKPVVAIGGITMETVRDVLACGPASVAVISDLLNCEDVVSRTREWLEWLE
jgi:thiamine-phosphate pyrophosphorylase